MRLANVVLALLAGCAQLGVVGDGTAISVGKPSQGHLVDGVRMPDAGEGFFTRDQWRTRGNRYGTEELVDLISGVSRRMHARIKERIVVADLSKPGGGAARQWHMSHQSGRDVDLLYYVRDKDGNAVEPDKMSEFGPDGKAKDGSGQSVDVPRMWLLIRELLTAPEAPVQWMFLYEPLAKRILEHARAQGEPDALLAKARQALHWPGPVAPHDDHLHVRIYCSKADRAFGCIDSPPYDLLVARESELGDVAYKLPVAPVQAAAATPAVAAPAGGGAASQTAVHTELRSIGRMLRTPDHLLPRWR